MDIFRKVNAIQLYLFWRNLALSLVIFVGVLAFTKMLPSFLSPLVSLIGAGMLYSMIYTNKMRRSSSCMAVVFVIFITLIIYTFILILVNLLYYLKLTDSTLSFLLFNHELPYLPSLLLFPTGAFVMLYVYLSKNGLSVCTDCKISRGDMYSRGKLGMLLNRESKYQEKNLLVLFASLTAVMWTYYLLFFINININSRDQYIFIWLAVICIVIDEIYFVFRYYNLYMDLQENGEILTQEDVDNISNSVYLRVYLVCGNSLYLDQDAKALDNSGRKVLDTPLFFKIPKYEASSVNDIKDVIERNTGLKNGELRFFFRQHNRDLNSQQRIDRYFYFVEDEKECPMPKLEGGWIDFNVVKHLYSTNPQSFSTLAVSDITRLATIILTEKVFDEEGQRKNKIKKYQPTFSLEDVKKSNLDFQDNKWIHVSMFNSDVKFYKLKKFWYRFLNDNKRITDSHDNN